MTNKITNPSNSLTLAEIDAFIAQARTYRAEVTREMMSKVLAWVASPFKRLAAFLRPSHERLPHTGACA
ncbi:MAG: hypothetical protein HY244_19135 [Rhizobiales bacterium]|nr:hypothetical protein [Hyphomicrobiales bacterium]